MTLTPFLAALALTGQGYRDRFPLPDLTAGAGWGVNIHFADPAPGEVEMIRDAGFRWVRMDLTWSIVERTRGTYDFRAYDRLMGHLERNGLRALLILDYGNDLYEPGAPRSPQARRAFVRFVEAAVARYKGRGVVWELWNEPNNPRFWRPSPDAGQYAALAREAGRALRRAAPEEWFVGPATSGFDWEFLERCLDEGLLDVFDALTVHPYRTEAPETVGADWHRLRGLVATRTTRAVPLLSGEWGYSERTPGQNAARQAQYAVRQYLANLASGVGMSIWYDWRNDGPSPTEIEHHFGTVDLQMRPKPAYTAIRDLARSLAGTRFDRLLPSGTAQTRYLFAGAAPKVVEAGDAGIRVRDATPDEALAARLPVPTPLEAVDGPDGLAAMLSRTLGALKPGEALGVRVGGGRPELFPGGDALSVLRELGRGSSLTRVVLEWRRPAGTLLAYEGRWSRAQALGITLKPSGDRGRLEVRVAAGGSPPGEPLEVELHIGLRVLVKTLAMGPEGGVASFPWYPWEGRSDLEVRVLGGSGRLLGSLGPLHASPIDVLDPARLRVSVEGDPAVPGRAEHTLAPAPAGGPGPHALRLDYRFSPGWKYVALVDPVPVPLVGAPDTYSVWVFGDGSGDELRMRYVDASGQTFQGDLGTIDFRGWRRLRCSLRGDRGGHWGGANDGVVHLPIRITVPALVDAVSRRGTSGTLFLAEGTVVGTGD